jgi:hypothetical protein
MKSDKIQSTEESLAIITRMIEQTQGNLRSSSFHFILWGMIATLGFLGQYYLMEFTSYAHPYIIWLIAIPGWIISFVYGKRSSQHRGVSNYSDKIVMWTWVAFGFTILVVIFSGRFNELIPPVIMLLSAMATFITGSIIRFKPLLYGAGALWIFSAVALAVSPGNSLLVAALAFVAGYLIPGFILRSEKS